jgi:hypothetical protein
VHDLEAEARHIRYERNQSAADERARQERPREEAPLLLRRLALEDQRRPETNAPHRAMLLLETVEQPLHLGLVARVEARRDPVGRPRLVHEPVLRPRRVRTHGRRVHERGNARVGDRAEDPGGAVDVRASQPGQVARGLDRPGQVDDGVGAAHERRELVGRDVRARPLGLAVAAGGRQPAGQAEHGVHARVLLERREKARSNVAGGAEDDDPHRPPLPVTAGTKRHNG